MPAPRMIKSVVDEAGLGKFVWDEFQNGSSNSLGRIMVAVIVIGIVGFMLDYGMLKLQRQVSWDKSTELR